MKSSWTARVTELIQQGRLADARDGLRSVLARMPTRWQALVRLPHREVVFCWTQDEFQAYVQFRHLDVGAPPIDWAEGSFSMAYFLLAFLELERGHWLSALYCLEHGLALEPDHPKLLCEKGYVLSQRRRFPEALAFYERAETSRPWLTAAHKALALRGQGFCLVELGRIEDARERLLRCLNVEPENETALSELAYIDTLDSERSAGASVGALPMPVAQYAVVRLEDKAFLETDPLMRFYSPRAAVDRLVQLGEQTPRAMIVRTDKLPFFLGRSLEEAPIFGGLTYEEWNALDQGDEQTKNQLFDKMNHWRTGIQARKRALLARQDASGRPRR